MIDRTSFKLLCVMPIPSMDRSFSGIFQVECAWYTSLALSQCTLAGQVYTGMLLECHWLTQCTLGYHWATQRILHGTLEHHWKNWIENALHWNTTGGIIAAHTHTHTKHISIHVSLKWQDDGTPSRKWTGLSKFSFYLEFTALQCIPVLLFKRVSTSTSLCACLG